MVMIPSFVTLREMSGFEQSNCFFRFFGGGHVHFGSDDAPELTPWPLSAVKLT